MKKRNKTKLFSLPPLLAAAVLFAACAPVGAQALHPVNLLNCWQTRSLSYSGPDLLGGDDAVVTAAAGEYGAWRSTGNWSGLDFRVRCVSYNEYARRSEWQAEFRNRYRQKINFSFELTDQGAHNPRLTHRTSVRSGDTDWTWKLLYTPCGGNTISVWVGQVRFGEDDTGPYARPN
ncbi:MAG: hypothetical protein ACRD68_16565 [Pyrinomonadaceae bacterium]